jgi:S-DNA-T family DNA segregation ATPase FtsK/SpoIIIE
VPRAVLSAGASRFVLAAAADDVAPTRPDSTGCTTFNRPPRRRGTAPPTHVHFPEPPLARERRPLPVLAVLAPLVLGLVLWQVLGSATFLLFTLLSPVLVIGSAVSELRAGRRHDRRERERWRLETDRAREQLTAALRADEQLRRTSWPDPAATFRTASGPGERLWERRRTDDDVLSVALGSADQAAQVRVTGQPPRGAVTARAVPAVVSLTEVGVLGVAGPGASPTRSAARWATLQAAVWHSPRDLQIVVLTASGAASEWEWARWLPHVRPTDGQDCHALLGFGSEQARTRVAELQSLVVRRRGERPGGAASPRRVLLVVDGAHALREVPGLADLLAEGPAVGVHALVVEDDPRLLPESCGALAVVGGAEGTELELVVAGRAALPGVLVDGVSAFRAEQVARALAPLRDATDDRRGEAGLPPQLSWAELVGLPLSGGTVEAVRERWSAGGDTTVAELGVAAGGRFAVDLCADGPHALVAGTTGSGKSELLQTWIASLALGNRPDALSLVLIDYKGGAAFGPCADLPHVVGVVTDLDGALAARALASLRAELRRREALLAATGAKDLEAHRRLAGSAASLPRLVLMVDEFAALAEELPDFVGGLVDIAMRGRSLGVHLVLATQRPGGVVSPDIRANTNLRVCLAVARDTDSRDVLDSPVAAGLSRSTPGRCFARTGHTELTALQVARVSGPRRAQRDGAPRVVMLPALELGDPVPPPATAPAAGATELALLVDACRAATAQLGLPTAPPPWLPPLPPTVALAALPPYDDPLGERAGRVPPLAFGLLDLPEQQRQVALLLDLDRSTHLLVVGAPRSGRTTVLRTLAGALASTAAPEDVHVYVVDATGHGLGGLAELPHTGAVVTRGQTDRLERMLGWLLPEVSRRQEVLASGGHSSLAEQRAAVAPEQRLPHLVLLVDGFDAFLADHQERESGRLVDAVHALLREGPRAGLHVVLTADRSGLSGRLAALVDTRLVLRLADRGDYAVAGVPDRLVGAAPPPGRGWVIAGEGPQSAQVALLSPDPSGAAQAASVAELASLRPVSPPGRGPRQFLALPRQVPRRTLRPRQPPPDGVVLLGAGGDEVSPTLVDLTAGFLVAGPPGSGRSTALCTLAAGLQDAALPFVVVAPRPSPLRERADPARCLLDAADVAALEALLAQGPRAVLVDDAELVVQSPLAPALERVVRQTRDTGTFVVAAGTTDDLVLGYRGLVVDVRRSRTGLLLSPQGPADGDLLGVRLPLRPPPTAPPGRGLLCVRGQVEPVQVAV